VKTTTIITKLALAAACAVGVSACAAPMRAVTHISGWSNDKGDYFYLAYTENQIVSRVKLCRILQDNAVSCVEQPAVDKLLNP